VILIGKTAVLGDKFAQYQFAHEKPRLDWLGFEPGSPQSEAGEQQAELWNGF
jgi:hypothetical protein